MTTTVPLAPAPPARAAAPPAARTIDATKVYGRGDTEVRALDGVSVEVPTATFTAVMGPSGSGKSTLMHCLAGLDTVTSGRVLLGDTDLGSLNDRALTRLRRTEIGFVFQAFNLLPTLTAIENITLPLDLARATADPAGVLHGRPWLPRPAVWLSAVIRVPDGAPSAAA